MRLPFLAALPITWLAAQRGSAPAVAVIWQGRIELWIHARNRPRKARFFLPSGRQA